MTGFLCLQTDIVLSVGKTALMGFLAKPEVLGCDAGENRALGFPDSRADPDQDFGGWEKNMTLKVIALEFGAS